MQDKKYGEFQAKLIPTIDKKTIIGVRTPELKAFAKEMLKGSRGITSDDFLLNDVEKFLDELPHKYFDENQLHVFILSEMKDFDICIKRVNEFLPYVNNWATCDQLSPKCFKKNKEALLKHINKWIKSNKSYVIRFAIEMLMSHFLDEDFDEKYLKMVSDVKFKARVTRPYDIDPDKYYVEMMRAWFFATALAKQYDATIPFIKNNYLNTWTHNKTIQKACESFRVSESHKKELKKYKK
jgi:3-methyladenine DNA glycosylase AlkD